MLRYIRLLAQPPAQGRKANLLDEVFPHHVQRRVECFLNLIILSKLPKGVRYLADEVQSMVHLRHTLLQLDDCRFELRVLSSGSLHQTGCWPCGLG